MVKKYLTGLAVFLLLATSLLFTAKNLSASDRPKGLEDKGPLTKITFIHYKKGAHPAKPDGVGKPKPGDTTTSCYGFLAKGVYWKSNLPRTLHVNTASFSGLDQNFVLSAVNNSANAWDSVTATDLFANSVVDNNANWDNVTPDYNSELVKAAYPDSGVIAVTNVWGYFGGPPQTREIVDFDILFNSSFDWGDGLANPTKMDLQNIATHELGHGWGLDDIYSTSCSAVTMYGYSSNGDTEKRTLEPADVTGIQSLYN